MEVARASVQSVTVLVKMVAVGKTTTMLFVDKVNAVQPKGKPIISLLRNQYAAL
jgi:hypothetical protein